MKNSYAVKLQTYQSVFAAGQKIGFQRACDFIAIALNDPDCMGKSVMSGERIHRIFEHAIMLNNTNDTAFTPRDPEADYYQEKIDAWQKRIFKDKFVPFYERYKDIKKCEYR